MATETSRLPPKKNGEKFDPFRPDMPQIPGLSEARRRGARGASLDHLKRIAQVAGIILAATAVGMVVVWGGVKAVRRIAGFRPAGPVASEVSDPTSSVSDSISSVPDVTGSTRVAIAGELSKPWSAKKFAFVKPFTRESVDAMVVRLPGGGLWAFALQQPYGRCELEYVTDLQRLATQYHYRASHPVVVSPCDNTIYDPLKIGSVGGGVWARGDVVQGGGLRPPFALDVQQRGRFIIANRME
jgi:hypothetical protein